MEEKKKKKRRISSSNHPFSFSVKFFCSSHPVLLHAHLIRFIHKFKKFISLLFWGEEGGEKEFLLLLFVTYGSMRSKDFLL